jgi:hypothetical protein
MNPKPKRRIGWRTLADVVALVACAGAAVWVFAGGQQAFLISYVDLGFHELGHLLLGWAPGLVAPLAGSVVQVAVPIGLALYFARRRESYAIALLLGWAATSAAGVSVYVADGPVQALNLLGYGRHDWAWVLGQTGNMGWAPMLSSGVRWFGVALAVIGALVALTSLVSPHAKERAESRLQAERDAREAELRAKAPRHEPRTREGVTTRPNVPGARHTGAPPAPAGRF